MYGTKNKSITIMGKRLQTLFVVTTEDLTIEYVESVFATSEYYHLTTLFSEKNPE